MKKSLVIAGMVLMSVCGLSIASSGLNKNSTQLKSLGQAWKTHSSVQINQQDEINMVYGGADISRRPTLALHMTTA
ncbi:MAG TPA: hypothetical protein VHZ76_01610 [Gammaproteobacteria bacterium]|jgi:hypothetical protein|nr:hypothetical protein [Gammaproteobacteria bacterium]